MEEVWKDIPEYEGLYQVSNFGRIKSLPRKYKKRYIKKENIKSPSKLPKGYLRIGLCKEGKIKYYAIHRLVAESFISNEDNKPCVNHKDCNPSNNKVDNLEWCSYLENNNYKNHHLKRNMSSVIYYLKRDYPDKLELIRKVQQIKDEINLL